MREDELKTSMREIKFRAWDTQAKKYGSGFLIDEDGKRDYPESGWDWHGSDNKNLILEQWTGLLDKNGKEIYEGDIVKIGKRGGNSPVVYMDGGPRVEQKNYREAMRIHKHGAWVELWVEASTCEVIGNIHENPELLQ